MALRLPVVVVAFVAFLTINCNTAVQATVSNCDDLFELTGDVTEAINTFTEELGIGSVSTDTSICGLTMTLVDELNDILGDIEDLDIEWIVLEDMCPVSLMQAYVTIEAIVFSPLVKLKWDDLPLSDDYTYEEVYATALVVNETLANFLTQTEHADTTVSEACPIICDPACAPQEVTSVGTTTLDDGRGITSTTSSDCPDLITMDVVTSELGQALFDLFGENGASFCSQFKDTVDEIEKLAGSSDEPTVSCDAKFFDISEVVVTAIEEVDSEYFELLVSLMQLDLDQEEATEEARELADDIEALVANSAYGEDATFQQVCPSVCGCVTTPAATSANSNPDDQGVTASTTAAKEVATQEIPIRQPGNAGSVATIPTGILAVAATTSLMMALM